MDSSLIVLLILVGALLLGLTALARFKRPRLDKQYFQNKWTSVTREPNLNMAILKADSLVDEALRHAGVRGQTMGERLNNAAGILRDLNGTWSAHKLRNRLAHEVDAQVSSSEGHRALRRFEKALKDLGAL